MYKCRRVEREFPILFYRFTSTRPFFRVCGLWLRILASAVALKSYYESHRIVEPCTDAFAYKTGAPGGYTRFSPRTTTSGKG